MDFGFWIFGLALAVGASSAFAETVNRIAAVVNDEIITEADVAAHVEALLDQDEEPALAAAQEDGRVRDAVLQRLIEQQLILQEAKRAGTTVSSEAVAKQFEQLRARAASDEEFRASLREAGLSEERLKERLRNQLMVEEAIETTIRSTITVSPQEVAQEVARHPELSKPGDRVRASHLLIRVTDGRSESQARALIEDLRRQVTAGAPFAALAKRYSEDSNAPEGGAMGWIAPGTLMPELDAALFQLTPGVVSGPIRTTLGLHLLKLEERATASQLSVMEAHAAVSRMLYQRKFRDALQRWVDELRRRAYIEILK